MTKIILNHLIPFLGSFAAILLAIRSIKMGKFKELKFIKSAFFIGIVLMIVTIISLAYEIYLIA